MRRSAWANAAFAAVGILFAVPASAALAPPAAVADSNDDTFLKAMAYVGLVSDEGSAGLIHLGHTVCNDRAKGYSDSTTASMVNDTNPGLGMNGAGYIVATAEHVYCPQFSNPQIDPSAPGR